METYTQKLIVGAIIKLVFICGFFFTGFMIGKGVLSSWILFIAFLPLALLIELYADYKHDKL